MNLKISEDLSPHIGKTNFNKLTLEKSKIYMNLDNFTKTFLATEKQK